jgi:hypothetical protein
VSGDGNLTRDEFALWWREGERRWAVFVMSDEQMARVYGLVSSRTTLDPTASHPIAPHRGPSHPIPSRLVPSHRVPHPISPPIPSQVRFFEAFEPEGGELSGVPLARLHATLLMRHVTTKDYHPVLNDVDAEGDGKFTLFKFHRCATRCDARSRRSHALPSHHATHGTRAAHATASHASHPTVRPAALWLLLACSWWFREKPEREPPAQPTLTELRRPVIVPTRLDVRAEKAASEVQRQAVMQRLDSGVTGVKLASGDSSLRNAASSIGPSSISGSSSALSRARGLTV